MISKSYYLVNKISHLHPNFYKEKNSSNYIYIYISNEGYIGICKNKFKNKFVLDQKKKEKKSLE